MNTTVSEKLGWHTHDMNATFRFGDVYYIKDNKVMLYKTHPNYPKMYGDDDE